ncbi:MAG: hypothetical protein JO256_05560 [Alphaproteobacteria bacterium]|nr:hypothetical protein [Alphaproteobacteria bacterium]
MRTLLLALMFVAALGGGANAAPWRIVKDHWEAADERGFGAFVTALGQSGCNSAQSCLRSAANPWRGSDGNFMDIDADCAKFPYLLRAYYAWKNGLPFAYADGVRGERFSKGGNRVVSRAEIIDHGGGIDAKRAILTMMDNVFSGTYRIDAGSADGLPSDFYSPALAPGSIRPGTVIYDPNGHVGIVWQVDGAGRIFYMDAHPDFTVSRSVYGAQFGQSPMALGGGLKNWRPLRLEGARWSGGSFVGGHVVVARQREIGDFSLVQYAGTDGQGHFAYNGVALGFYEYVRAAVSGGRTDYNPVYELQTTMRTLCNDLTDRAQAVQQAVANGIAAKPHPARLPANIYSSDDGEWEAYATPARDARLRAAFVQFRKDLGRMIGLWLARDPRIVYDGQFLKDDLLRAYDAQSEACRITFLTSDKRPVVMNFEGMARHLLAMSFDPYVCEALRWGDTRPESCADGEAKRRWHDSEGPMRAEIGRDEGGTGQAITAADVDISGLIAAMPARAPFVQRYPG